MESTTEQLRDAQRGLNQMQTELASLKHDRSLVGAKSVLVQTLIAQLAPDYFGAATNNNILNTPLSRGAQAQVVSLSQTLSLLTKQGIEMDRKILAYQARIAVVTGKGMREAETLEQGETEVLAIQKRAKRAEYQLTRRDKPATARLGILSDKLAMFSTYAPFPYAQERQRVLSWFAK